MSRIVTGADGHVAAVELAGRDPIDADAVVVGPRFRVRAEPFESLGLRPAAHPSGLGDFVETDATGATAVPGLYAAGNVTDPSQQVLPAAANGSRVGGDDQLQSRSRRHPSRGPTIGQRGRLGSSLRRRADLERQPERHARQRDRGLAPGRALDVGAGEGGDALWLAEQGWNVTASDISQRALDRVDAEAERRGLPVECHHAERTDSVRSSAPRSTSCRRSTRRFRAHPMAAVCATSWTRLLLAARCSSSATISSRCVRRSTR